MIGTDGEDYRYPDTHTARGARSVYHVSASALGAVADRSPAPVGFGTAVSATWIGALAAALIGHYTAAMLFVAGVALILALSLVGADGGTDGINGGAD